MSQYRLRLRQLFLGTALLSLLSATVGCGGTYGTAMDPGLSTSPDSGNGRVSIPGVMRVRPASFIGGRPTVSAETVVVHYRPGFKTSGLFSKNKLSIRGKTVEERRVPAGMTAEQFRQQIVREPGVERVEQEAIYYPADGELTPPGFPTPNNDPVPSPNPYGYNPPGPGMMAPNDPFFPLQWHLSTIGVLQAWLKTMGDPNLIVAVLDTGVDYTHPDLEGKVIKGENYGGDWSDPNNPKMDVVSDEVMDDVGHGTHVSGIIAANANNGRGVAGVAPKVKILAVKISQNNGEGRAYSFSMARGILYAADHGAKVINISFGGGSPSMLEKLAVDYAVSKGCLIVAAAGNDSTKISFPAGFPRVMAISATNTLDKLASFSNFGYSDLKNPISLAAPGVRIVSTTPSKFANGTGGDYYDAWDGTSMATPVVSGAAALVWSAHPDWTPEQVRQRLEVTADPVGDLGFFGRGRVNVARALAD